MRHLILLLIFIIFLFNFNALAQEKISSPPRVSYESGGLPKFIKDPETNMLVPRAEYEAKQAKRQQEQEEEAAPAAPPSVKAEGPAKVEAPVKVAPPVPGEKDHRSLSRFVKDYAKRPVSIERAHQINQQMIDSFDQYVRSIRKTIDPAKRQEYYRPAVPNQGQEDCWNKGYENPERWCDRPPVAAHRWSPRGGFPRPGNQGYSAAPPSYRQAGQAQRRFQRPPQQAQDRFTNICRQQDEGLVWYFEIEREKALLVGRKCFVDVEMPNVGFLEFEGIATDE